ncbi:alpha/beta hydrolase [Pectobacterium aquaticum]|uniref:alpha/beta hydrolase n=1 Tax=Pectobacterium aquaticum TaxID=2204145 RepID=UPI000E2352F4|nr:carboxylesterase [Pectobacterium aquaticum]RRN97779.1 carboxylesterase [Pectobacterium aquaticum]
MKLLTPHHPPLEFETGPQPQAAIILLHGLGSTGKIFEPVARSLNLHQLGSIRVILPNAPIQPVRWAGGQHLAAWYDLRDPNFVLQEDEDGLRIAMAYYKSLIQQEITRGIRPERIVIGGFSQGCALSLMTGIRFVQRLGGIFGLSGYLPLASTTVTEQHPANYDTPVFLAYGEQDRIVLPTLAATARDILQAQGHSVSWHTYPMPHTICGAELIDLGNWLVHILES